MELKNKPRKDFYANELNMDRMFEMLKAVSGQLTLRESLKMMCEMVYDMTSYWSDDNKGIVYNGEYSEDHIWQATMLGNGLRALADVFNQSIVEKREYDQDYFKKWDLNYLQAVSGWKDEKISELKKELKELRDSIEEE